MNVLNIINAALCVWTVSIASETIILHVRKEDVWEKGRHSCQWPTLIYLILITVYVIERGYVTFKNLSEVEFYEVFVVMIALVVLIFDKYRVDRLVTFAFLISSVLALLIVWCFGVSPLIISVLYLLIPLTSYLYYLYRKSKA